MVPQDFATERILDRRLKHSVFDSFCTISNLLFSKLLGCESRTTEKKTTNKQATDHCFPSISLVPIFSQFVVNEHAVLPIAQILFAHFLTQQVSHQES